MRLSCMHDDPGYDGAASLWATVYLDGKPLDYCVTADEELGEALCYVVKDGELQLDETRERVLTELKRGVVKIVLNGARPGKLALLPRDYCGACGYTDSHDPNCPAKGEGFEATQVTATPERQRAAPCEAVVAGQTSDQQPDKET